MFKLRYVVYSFIIHAIFMAIVYIPWSTINWSEILNQLTPNFSKEVSMGQGKEDSLKNKLGKQVDGLKDRVENIAKEIEKAKKQEVKNSQGRKFSEFISAGQAKPLEIDIIEKKETVSEVGIVIKKVSKPKQKKQTINSFVNSGEPCEHKYGGIGLGYGLPGPLKNSYIVSSVAPGSPVEKAGIQVGDVFMDDSIQNQKSKFEGTPGTVVKITFYKGLKKYEKEITRAEICYKKVTK